MIIKKLRNKIILFVSVLSGAVYIFQAPLFAQNRSVSPFRSDFRADTFDIRRNDLHLNITDFTGKTISGYASLRIGIRQNGVTSLPLDLMQSLQVDSVVLQNTHLTFQHSNNRLRIQFPQPQNSGDSLLLHIYYGGPALSGGGNFGGFYWTGGYAFNLGVTLNDIPHSAGRFWFPCIDDFNVKSQYGFHIEVTPPHKAICGGVLYDTDTLPGGNHVYHWNLSLPIPAYLASVNVNAYQQVTQSYQSLYGPQIPMLLHALAADTTNMKNSFVNLGAAMHSFENRFGPYLFPRVGYSLVPFSGGAMEHACNIAYPRIVANGTTAYQTLMAHELSHHWWGDNTTCETAEEMWLNEGFASFCELQFLEDVVSYQSAYDTYMGNLDMVLDKAHVDDGGYWPLSGVPQTYTYGTHTYTKGSNVIRSLRTYMGDSLFYTGMKQIQADHLLGNINTEDLISGLENSSGLNLQDFKNDWLLQPGFATVTLDSFTWQNNICTVFALQKNRAVTHPYAHIPLYITCIGANRQQFTTRVDHAALNGAHSFALPFQPVVVALNRQHPLALATIGVEKEIKSTGNIAFTYTKAMLRVGNAGADSTFIRIENHRVPPEASVAINDSLWISPGRYWTIQGIRGNGFNASLSLNIDGATNGYDQGIITTQDKLRIVYRRNSGEPWTVYEDDTVFTFSASTKKGSIDARNVKFGDYAVASVRSDLGTPAIPSGAKQKVLQVWPNPAQELLRFSAEVPLPARIQVYDASGKQVLQRNIQEHSLDISGFRPGLYSIVLKDQQKTYFHATFVKQ
ncbi:MAG: T9SS type A sorting domain-containing protein [Bacteroidia bacterium]|nr:T9SS type A sorting domain-containing protein [Bacteroidia bacterium]